MGDPRDIKNLLIWPSNVKSWSPCAKASITVRRNQFRIPEETLLLYCRYCESAYIFHAANERDKPWYSTKLGCFSIYIDEMAVWQLVETIPFWSRDNQRGWKYCSLSLSLFAIYKSKKTYLQWSTYFHIRLMYLDDLIIDYIELRISSHQTCFTKITSRRCKRQED